MRSNPTLAIDLPMKALVWQDDAGKVWLTYNSADYLGTALYPATAWRCRPKRARAWRRCWKASPAKRRSNAGLDGIFPLARVSS